MNDDTFFDRMLEAETFDLGDEDEEGDYECLGVVSMTTEEFESLTNPCRKYTDDELRTMLQHARARELGQIH